MKNFVKISLVLPMLFLTACAEEKLYTVEELKENPALAEKILRKTYPKNPTEIDLQNMINAEEVAFESVFGHLREAFKE